MKLFCVACFMHGEPIEAFTVYRSHALCKVHLKQALKKKKEKFW